LTPTCEEDRSSNVEADIASSQQVEDMVARCIAEFGKIDILVNNADIGGPIGVPAWEVSGEGWGRALAVNLTGTFLYKIYVNAICPNFTATEFAMVESWCAINDLK